MASGMHAAAAGQLGSFPTASFRAIPEVNLNEPVEIAMLSAEKSEEASRVLQERSLYSRPMVRYGRMLQCQESLPSARLRRGPAADDRHPIFRAAAQYVPILSVIPTLTWSTLRADAIAGLTVGVMVIPQSMSYASVAGLELKYGIYAACLPAFVYAFFGQSGQLAVGPVAMVSLLIGTGLQDNMRLECQALDMDSIIHNHRLTLDKLSVECGEEYVNLSFAVSACVGLVLILGSIMRLDFLMSFLGHPVMSGFSSGSALIIGISQMEAFLGVKIEKSEHVYVLVYELVSKWREVDKLLLFLSCSCLGFLMTLKRLGRRNKKLKYLAAAGPLIACILGVLLVYARPGLVTRHGVRRIGHLDGGLMPLSLGALSWASIVRVRYTAASVALVGCLESFAIGKILADEHGYQIEPAQELLAVGLANLAGSAFSCFPVTGSFSRSAVANSTGAVSQLAGIITSLVMLCTMLWLTPLFYDLPMFVLACIVMNAVISLFAYDVALELWKVKKHDFLLWMLAFFGTLFLGPINGIGVAVALSLLIVIYESARPQISILWRLPGTEMYRTIKQELRGQFVPGVFVARVGASLYFANSAYVKEMLVKYIADMSEVDEIKCVVLELTSVVTVDATAVHMLRDLVRSFRAEGIEVAFSNIGRRVEKTMMKADLLDFIGEEWVFSTTSDAVRHCLAHQKAVTASRSDASVKTYQFVATPEVGFSNDLHRDETVVYISFAREAMHRVGEVAAVFRQHCVTIVKMQVENKRHTYHVTGMQGGKLTSKDLRALQQDLERLLALEGGAPQGGAPARSQFSAG